jgi:hypothetical protein
VTKAFRKTGGWFEHIDCPGAVYSHVGDKLYASQAFPEFLNVEALKGIVTGNYVGDLTVAEDDPAPMLSVVASQVTSKEGQWLR